MLPRTEPNVEPPAVVVGEPSVPVGQTDGPAAGAPSVGPIDVVGSIVSGAVTQIGTLVRPEAAVAVATEFTFPLALALMVMLYVVAQDQVDRRDPKLRIAPERASETLIRFESEDQT